ncbi:hypothetical protein BKP37_14415 [Anaerobacillus alkalilacustris]|uniref:Transcriptional regulator n=1 Tax=Anaerobacillus alkalilacustris TaxID=393763 RepID=A0A1S2LHS9_9BACI|nr:ROK family protein [Anaerobacillus alkalilacustris]OIJ12072.1 hypothetical protein BKP37_14415 [Anaerobacillus alkalilacustris]
MKKYISLDVGGTKVKHGLLTEEGTILSKGSYYTNCSELDTFVSDMIQTIIKYATTNEISGVAVSLPGYINPSTGYSEKAGSIIALDGQNLKKLLEDKIPYHVEIENDGNCAALAEKWNGHAQDCSDFIVVTIGTGIGGGIFVNGQILHGHSFRGGEFGFMITRGGMKNDIMHFNASTSSLVQAYKQLKKIDKDEKVAGEVVFSKAIEEGDVQELINKWLESISFGIYNLAATLNPQKILIGGGVSARESLVGDISDQLGQLEFWNEVKVPIEACKHRRNDAGMIGALYHFIQEKVNVND